MKNIEEFVVSRLDTVEGLRGKVFPTAAPVGGTEAPFAIFRMTKEDQETDMDGEIGVRTAVIRVEFFDDDNDRLCSLLDEAQEAMRAGDEDLGDIYIYRSLSARGEEDDLDQTLDLLIKNLTVTVDYWR